MADVSIGILDYHVDLDEEIDVERGDHSDEKDLVFIKQRWNTFQNMMDYMNQYGQRQARV